MNHIVMKEKKERKYYLGASSHLGYYTFPISFDYPMELYYRVCSEMSHIEWDEIDYTDSIHRELTVGEFINIDGNDYQIIKVAHDLYGNIIYYTNFIEYIDNEESKLKAEEDKEKRDKFLEEKKSKEREVTKVSNETEINKKKWYQFWVKE